VEEPVAAPARNIPMPGARTMVKLPSMKDIHAQLSNPVTAAPALTEQAPEEAASGPARQVHPEILQAVWRELANQKKQEGKMAEFMILDRPVQLNEKLEIWLHVENPVQLTQFDAIRGDFMADLRRRLGNNRVNVRLAVREQQEGRKLYTSQDKFAYLSEKYPILPELKKRLGLDTDF
jgi:DNA polymerase III subunit gamma/tau